MGVLWELNLSCIQNEDTTYVLGYANASSTGQLSLATPYSFSGASASFTVNETNAVNSTNIVTLTSGAGQITFGTATVQQVSQGTITITIPHTTTVNFPVGVFYYDLLVTIGSQKQYYAAGTFTVLASVSR